MNFSDFTSSLPIKNIYLDLHEMATAILDEKLHYLTRKTRNLTRRYTVSYHLAYYLLNGSDVQNYVHYLVPASFPVDFNEQLCHLLASFLLMPIEAVDRLMMLYEEKVFSSQMSFNSWLDYLGNTMGVSAYYTATAFERVRTLHVFLNEEHAEFL